MIGNMVSPSDPNVINEKCLGCSICKIVCPAESIQIKLNVFGFLSSSVNEDSCIMCGKCLTICPAKNGKTSPNLREIAYVAVARDKTILNKSSSGGIGYVLAYHALKEKYKVCGVTYDTDSNMAKHIIINSAEDLVKIQGSKYLQSSCLEAFEKIIRDKEKAVIFGTPCQIAGMDALLKKDMIREKFILVDIFCHGVPSYLSWFLHLKAIKKEKVLRYVSFRKGKNYTLKIDDYSADSFRDAWYLMFLRGQILNQPCYSCHFRRRACSDIRMGDLALKKYRALRYYPSVVITNTEAGDIFLRNCTDELSIYRENWSEVDFVQQKEASNLPESYKIYMKKLVEGKAPNLIKKRKYIDYLKAHIRKLLALIEKYSIQKDDLELDDILDKKEQ